MICFLLCVFLVAPLGGANLTTVSLRDWVKLAVNLVMLKAPQAPAAFEGLPYAALNGSMWTISYEFRCYLLAGLLGALGLYRHRYLYLTLTVLLVLANLLFLLPLGDVIEQTARPLNALLGTPAQSVRLTATFMCGACLRLFPVEYKAPHAAVAGALLAGALFVPALAGIALMTLGAYVLFWAAYNISRPPLRTLNAKDDISYGVYLYAWPAGTLLLWYWRDMPLLAHGLTTLAAALFFGFLSWHLLEKRFMALKAKVGGPKVRISPPEPATAGPP